VAGGRRWKTPGRETVPAPRSETRTHRSKLANLIGPVDFRRSTILLVTITAPPFRLRNRVSGLAGDG
jgi:hypothetical protein